MLSINVWNSIQKYTKAGNLCKSTAIAGNSHHKYTEFHMEIHKGGKSMQNKRIAGVNVPALYPWHPGSESLEAASRLMLPSFYLFKGNEIYHLHTATRMLMCSCNSLSAAVASVRKKLTNESSISDTHTHTDIYA